MSQAVARHLAKSAREVRVGNCIFDVVGYDKREKLFQIVECKMGDHVTSLGHAFGQIAAYYAVLAAMGRDFLNAYTRKVPLRYDRLMEATHDNRQMRVAFYVALTDEACKQVELIRSVKKLLPIVGIIRVKDDGGCRTYLRCDGKKDPKLAEAIPTVVEILREKPDRPAAGNEKQSGRKAL
jgi:hypothetical protein